MINISLQTHPELYFDYRKGLDMLSKLDYSDYEYPEGKTAFHVYSEITTPKQLECVKSFLATQNLDHTKLVLWSDYDVSNNEMLAPYKDLIEMRVFNRAELAKGTVLENHPVWITGPWVDENHWMSSGLLRFLAPYHEGGVWSDMDVIFINDFKPILDQEFSYQWGSEREFSTFGSCAALMNIHKHSEHAAICLDEISKTPLAGGVCLDHMLLAKVYRRRPFTVFPSTFFNTEWLMSKTDLPFRKFMQNGFETIETDRDFLFLDAFAWHWHNTSNKDRTIEPGSKFDRLTQRTNKLLKEKGIL